MTSAETRVYKGVWGLWPLSGPGTKPLVGGQGAKPPEADDISACLYYILRKLNLKLLTLFLNCITVYLYEEQIAGQFHI